MISSPQLIRSVLDAARAAGAPVLYVRHVSLPPTHLGVGALRTAMAWQRVDRADAVTPTAFPPDAAHTQLVAESNPPPATIRCSTSRLCRRSSALPWRPCCTTGG